MEIMNRILCVVLLSITCYTSQTLLAQDTVVVVLLNWKNTDEPHIRSCKTQNDTIFETRGRNKRIKNQAEYEHYVKLTSGKKYYLFIDKHGRRMMEGYWSGEGFYDSFIFYHKNGEIKTRGNIGSNGKCGKWQHYNKKGELKKEESFSPCN